jgi:hypothetical protein
MPPPDEIRAAVAAIMARSCLPEAGRTGAAVTARWKKITERKEELVMKPGPMVWPKTGNQQQEQGKSSYATCMLKWPGGGGAGGGKEISKRKCTEKDIESFMNLSLIE